MSNDPFDQIYPIVVRPDAYPDGKPCFVAEHPDLPGCSAHGTTVDEARELLSHARVAYLKYLISKDRNPPLSLPFRQREWQIGSVTMSGAVAISGTFAPASISATELIANRKEDTPMGGMAVPA
jgi:predicted RNase H-like HicB family nuclease